MAWGAILGMVGGVLGAAGNYRSDMAQVGKMNFDAGVALNNARLVEADMQLVRERGADSRRALTIEEQQVRGDARTQFAAGNVVVDQGSAGQYDMEQAAEFEALRDQSRDEQDVELYRLGVERQGLLSSAEMLRRGARSAKTTARIGLVGGILGSAGRGIGYGRGYSTGRSNASATGSSGGGMTIGEYTRGYSPASARYR